MKLSKCTNPDCTAVETGTCLLSNKLDECPNYSTTEHTGLSGLSDLSTSFEKNLSVAARQFHVGLELGILDAFELMRARYSHLVGILGATDAGKTCFLSSLYLMTANGTLSPDYNFGGSNSLQGFEDRAWRVREWEHGRLPEQLADHTSLDDVRRPALLHLALREANGERRRIDLMLTDLPGEWSERLIQRADAAERFLFLRRADGIILAVDGPLLVSDQRYVELQRLRNLISRLANDVKIDPSTPFIILVTKCDEIQMELPPLIEDLAAHATKLLYRPTIVRSAAFSRTPDVVPNGIGVFDALRPIIQTAIGGSQPILQCIPTQGSRSFWNARNKL